MNEQQVFCEVCESFVETYVFENIEKCVCCHRSKLVKS